MHELLCSTVHAQHLIIGNLVWLITQIPQECFIFNHLVYIFLAYFCKMMEGCNSAGQVMALISSVLMNIQMFYSGT